MQGSGVLFSSGFGFGMHGVPCAGFGFEIQKGLERKTKSLAFTPAIYHISTSPSISAYFRVYVCYQ